MNERLRTVLLTALILVVLIYPADSSQYIATQTPLFLAINGAFASHAAFWLNVTALGDPLVLLSLLSFYQLVSMRTWAAFFAAVPVSTALSHGGKAVFAMPRPAAVLETDQFVQIGEVLRGASSVPSGHTTTVFTALTVVLLTQITFIRNAEIRRIAVFILIVVASVVALSRVTVGAHWPFDIVAGAFTGIVGGLSGVAITRPDSHWWRKMEHPSLIPLHLAFLGIIALSMMHKHAHLPIAWLACLSASLVAIKLLTAGTGIVFIRKRSVYQE